MIRERIFLRDMQVGFADESPVQPAKSTPSTWAVALTTSVVGAAAGWAIEEAARRIREKRKRR